jgi:thymidine kinase
MSIEVYVGPMWSGKTSTMCGAVERHHHARRRCVIIKYAKDTRYNHLSKSGGIVNHRGDEYHKVPIIETEDLSDVALKIAADKIEVIGIDEAQFYANAPEMISEWANNGIRIIIAALDATWQGKPFGRVGEIIAISDKVTKLNAVCMKCGNDAPFTCKISGNASIEEIGGCDKYIATCRKCFWQNSSF